jgi:hypothetical protein
MAGLLLIRLSGYNGNGRQGAALYFEGKGNNIMLFYIIQIGISLALIYGGLSGEYVLRGTNSSIALVGVGVLWLI